MVEEEGNRDDADDFPGGTTELKTREMEIEKEHRAKVDNEYTRLDRTMEVIRKCSRKQHGR